eukprot:315144_1
MSLHLDYHTYTVILTLFPIGCFLLIILQIISDSLLSNVCPDCESKKKQRTTKILLYCIYLTSMMCGWAGFSLHITNDPIWCEKFGFTPCFCFLGLSKAALYIFFLRRAESAQKAVHLTRCKIIFFHYVAPAYLFVYWMVYCILTYVVFAGKLVDDKISNCLFAKGELWFSCLAASIDMFNAMGSLVLFIHPLVKAVKPMMKNKAAYLKYLGFVHMMKWNIALTSIAATSSVITIFMFYAAKEYTWFFCLGDPFVNAFSVFLMSAPNRRFVKIIVTCDCRKIRIMRTEEEVIKNTLEIDGVVVNVATCKKNTLQIGGVVVN